MWKKRIRQIIAFLLVLAFFNQFPNRVLAQEQLSHRYISAVSIGTVKELEDAGYTVINENINEGGTPVYVGYQYTDNPDEAITDVSAMSMYGGFSPLSYKDQLLNDSQGVIEFGTMLQTAAEGFGEEYRAGNPYAKVAYDTLNAMMVPDEQGHETPLGDYLISRTCSLSDFKKLGLMSSNVVMSFILNNLCFGVADNSDESTWLEKLSANGPLVFADESGEALDAGSVNTIYREQYDAQYMQRAHRLYVAVSQFTENYTEALNRSGSLETMTLPDEETASDAAEGICEAIAEGGTLEFDEEAENASVTDDESCGDVFPLAIYALLDAKDEAGNPVYPYGMKADGTVRTLAEFFIEVGTMEDGEDAYRALYPMLVEQNGVTPLNDGQEVMTYLSGLLNMVLIACSDTAGLEEARTASAEQVQEILQINGGKRVSVWYDVNTDIYDASQDGVYWTSDFVREAAAHDRYDLLTKPTGIQDVDTQGKLKNAMIYSACVAVAALGAAMVVSKVLGAAFAVKGMVAMVSCAVSYLASTAMAYSTAVCISCVVGTFFLAVLAIAVLAFIVIALIKLFDWLLEDDEPELELTEIPKTIYDYSDAGEGSAVIYRAVNGLKTGKPANLNQGVSNTPWVALYYTKDKALGEPITADFEGEQLAAEPFYFSKGNQNPSENYVALKAFGSVTAANLNEGRSGVTGIFGFFHRLGDAVSKQDVQGTYISDVKLSSASGKSREEKAKTELINSGYAVVDYNLTTDSSIATYIGYKTSEDASDAITDLRVAYSTGLDPKSATITYGKATYGCCGNVGNLLLMESKWANAGTPILASDIVVTNKLGNAPEGYEPVNLFCGGPAFDFNNCGNWEMTSADNGKEGSKGWKNHTFIYFNPSVKFTSGTAYLGGLAFFSGNTDGYMAEMGWTQLTNTNLGNGAADTGITYDLSGVQDGKTVLCYSTTYNPYRAIYDVQYYGAEASAQGLPYNISIAGNGAVACDVFQQSGGGVGDNRTIRTSHAYRSNNWYEGGGYYDQNDILDTAGDFREFTKKNAKYAEWYKVNGIAAVCNICCTGLFVMGSNLTTVETAKPIRISELEVSASSEYNAENRTPVRAITDAYAEKGANLAFNDLYHSGNLYLYLRRADENAVIPTYVKSIKVVTVKGSDLDKNEGSSVPYDSAVYSLVSGEKGRLMAVNLSGEKFWNERTDTFIHMYVESSGQEEWDVGQAVICISHETKYEMALVWVTYTDAKSKGISDIVIYESADGTVPSTVNAADGSKTEACGSGFQKGSKGTTYFLRAVYNMGNQISDLIIDKEIMLRNYWTSVTTEGKASSYDQYYIKAEHSRKATMTYYVSGIYTATGANKTEALKTLLNQGCRYYCPFDLSPDGKCPLYVGYSLSTSYKNAFSGLLLQDAGQNNTIDTIIKGRDTYSRVTDSLNSGVYDSIICMYLTKSVRKACETGGTKASNGHYITDITFYTGTDLNDYATGKKSLDTLDAKTRAYVEDYILDDDGQPVYWDIVTDSSGKVINCNVTAIKGGTLSTTAPQVYMYIHYSDNKTPYLTGLSGSLFAQSAAVSTIVIASGGLVLLAAIYLIIKKKRAAQEMTEPQETERR